MNLNSINAQAAKLGIKPLTAEQLKNMSNRQIKQYLQSNKKIASHNKRSFKQASRTARKNYKAESSEDLKRYQIKHNTIRQGLAQTTALGAETIGAIASNQGSGEAAKRLDAVNQNISGGQLEVSNQTTEKGIVAKKRSSYDSRDEE